MSIDLVFEYVLHFLDGNAFRLRLVLIYVAVSVQL